DARTRIVQTLAVKPLPARDFTILIGDQRRPDEPYVTQRPAIAGRIGEVIGKLRGIDEQLLGHTAPNHAGPVLPELHGNSHALAHLRGKPPCPYAARTAADHEKIKIKHARFDPSFARLPASAMTCRSKKKARRCGRAFNSVHEQVTRYWLFSVPSAAGA